jgi:hypothetical protein
MAIPNKQNVTQRQVLSTIEDQSKYDTPNSRRLRVNASPLSMNVQAGQTQTSRLAEALTQLEPSIANSLIEKESDANAEEYRQAYILAERGEEFNIEKGKWAKAAYDSYDGLEEGSELSTKFRKDLESTPKGLDFDYQAYKEQWWQDNANQALEEKSEYYTTQYGKQFAKTDAQEREKVATQQVGLQKQKNLTALSVNASAYVDEAVDENGAVSVAQLDTWIADKMRLGQFGTRGEAQDMFAQVLLSRATALNQPELLDVLLLPHIDGTPSYGETVDANGKRRELTIKTWKESITANASAVETRERTARLLKNKDAIAEMEKEMMLKVGATEKDIRDMEAEKVRLGLYESIAESKKGLEEALSLFKKVETVEMEGNAMSIRTEILTGRTYSPVEIQAQYTAGNLSKEEAKSLMTLISTKEARQTALAKEGKSDTSTYVNREMGIVNTQLPAFKGTDNFPLTDGQDAFNHEKLEVFSNVNALIYDKKDPVAAKRYLEEQTLKLTNRWRKLQVNNGKPIEKTLKDATVYKHYVPPKASKTK